MAVKEFMTYEMTLLEREMEGEIKAVEKIAITLLEMGMSFETIQQATKLSIQRIKELAEKFKDKREDV